VLVMLAVPAASGSATVFRVPKPIGTYVVTGGTLEQKGVFFANASDELLSTDNCWKRIDNDQGKFGLHLTAVPGQHLGFSRLGEVIQSGTIAFKGRSQRSFTRNESYAPGLNTEKDNCVPQPAPRVPPDTSLCGKTLKVLVNRSLTLGPVPGSSGFGFASEPLLDDYADPFKTHCPSEDTYAVISASSADDTKAPDFTKDRHITLSGKTLDISADAILWPGPDEHDGSQRTTMTWTLKLTRISPPHHDTR
jgi:hypothetical protein